MRPLATHPAGGTSGQQGARPCGVTETVGCLRWYAVQRLRGRAFRAGQVFPGAGLVRPETGSHSNDVTVKSFPTIIGAMPAKLTCEDILEGGKVLGNTYPNGEDFFLQSCKQVPRK